MILSRSYCERAKCLRGKGVAVGMAEKAKEFVATGGEIYHGNVPDGGREHN